MHPHARCGAGGAVTPLPLPSTSVKNRSVWPPVTSYLYAQLRLCSGARLLHCVLGGGLPPPLQAVTSGHWIQSGYIAERYSPMGLSAAHRSSVQPSPPSQLPCWAPAHTTAAVAAGAPTAASVGRACGRQPAGANQSCLKVRGSHRICMVSNRSHGAQRPPLAVG